MALSDEERARLVRLLGMLGSAFAGERATAGEMADKLVRSKDMTWADIINQRPSSRRPEEKPYTPSPPPMASVAGKVDFIFRSTLLHLTDWEVKFLSDIRGRGMLTIKQQSVLDRILVRAGWRADG